MSINANVDPDLVELLTLTLPKLEGSLKLVVRQSGLLTHTRLTQTHTNGLSRHNVLGIMDAIGG